MALRKAIALAAVGDGSLGASGIAIPLTVDGKTGKVASVLPLTSGAQGRRRTAAGLATVAVFVTEAGRDLKPAPELIMCAYGLTPTELRVMFAIVEIGGLAEVAATPGIASDTVRSHPTAPLAMPSSHLQADPDKILSHHAGTGELPAYPE